MLLLLSGLRSMRFTVVSEKNFKPLLHILRHVLRHTFFTNAHGGSKAFVHEGTWRTPYKMFFDESALVTSHLAIKVVR